MGLVVGALGFGSGVAGIRGCHIRWLARRGCRLSPAWRGEMGTLRRHDVGVRPDAPSASSQGLSAQCVFSVGPLEKESNADKQGDGADGRGWRFTNDW